MRKGIVVILVVVLSSPLLAQDSRQPQSKRMWLLSAVALVAANVLDARSSMGRQELNPLLRNSRGEFAAGRGIAVKSAAIGGALAVQAIAMRRRPELRRTSSIVNFVSAGAVATIAVRNSGVR